MTHLGALIIPGAYYFLDLNRSRMLWILIPVAVAMIIVDIARLRRWKLWNFFKPMMGPMAREHEIKGDFTGAAYILVTACLVIALFNKPIAAAALAFIMTGDVAAALIGRKFGKHKFNHKSLEGSIAFWLVASAMVFLIPELPVLAGLIGALAAAITEAVSINVDDNATVPLVSGLIMHLLCIIL